MLFRVDCMEKPLRTVGGRSSGGRRTFMAAQMLYLTKELDRGEKYAGTDVKPGDKNIKIYAR